MNGELRSTSEELREELHSINEELVKVNRDLRDKVDELARSHSDTQNLMAATNVAAIFVDRDLRIMRITAQAAALFHLVASDVGRPLIDLRPRFGFDSIIADAEDILRTVQPIEREMRGPDGRDYLARTIVYRTANDSVGGVVLTFVDVTTLKKAEDTVRKSEERFRGIIEQTAAGVCLADLTGRITFANPHLAVMAGCSAAELVGKKLSEFVQIGGRAAYQLDLERLAADGTSLDVELRLSRPDGQDVWCNVNVAAIRDSTAKQVSCVAVFVDITRWKQAEESLQLSRQELKTRVLELGAEAEERKRMEVSRAEVMQALSVAQEEERGRISRELHDEVGQHITALLLGLKALEKELPPDSAQVATVQALQAITENVGRDIHEVALELRPTALDDLGLVTALSTFLEDWAARANLELAFDYTCLGETRLPRYLETTLYRVVCESIRNVVKHARAKTVSVILQRKPGQVVAIVEDDGVGFDMTLAASSGAAKRLGIVGMKERVALVNGEIAIESEPDRGTTVIVRLPLPADEGRI